MAFELTNTSATSQNYINKILVKKLDVFVIVYLNEIIIYTKNEDEEHIQVVWWVLDNVGKTKHVPSSLPKSGLPLMPLKAPGPHGRPGQTLCQHWSTGALLALWANSLCWGAHGPLKIYPKQVRILVFYVTICQISIIWTDMLSCLQRAFLSSQNLCHRACWNGPSQYNYWQTSIVLVAMLPGLHAPSW